MFHCTFSLPLPLKNQARNCIRQWIAVRIHRSRNKPREVSLNIVTYFTEKLCCPKKLKSNLKIFVTWCSKELMRHRVFSSWTYFYFSWRNQMKKGKKQSLMKYIYCCTRRALTARRFYWILTTNRLSSFFSCIEFQSFLQDNKMGLRSFKGNAKRYCNIIVWKSN